ncbi:MAG: TIGR03619 family F420-dependent LLM class oxidoreductase [Acidimicrobiales bacterium]|nr:TIGR03619 family F420-dependent LLM class oxidoreductase [Acidimicrobiales bacterium]
MGKTALVRFGFTMPNNLGLEDPADVVAVAVLAERLGFDSVWVAHHVFNIGYVRDRLGDKPYYDALTILTWAAAHTERVELGTSVLVLPYLHPATLAKQLATLDRLSRGRLVVGVGVGSLPEENAALGVDYERRGPLTDEFLAVMHELWTADDPRFDGEFYRFGDLKASPRPYQQPHPTIVVGGNRPPALRRAARWQGWHPMRLPPESMASRLPVIDEALADAGRSRADGFRVHACLDVDLWPAPRERPPRAPLSGTAEQLIDMVGRYAEVGVTDLVLSGMAAEPAALPDLIERFAVEVMAKAP